MMKEFKLLIDEIKEQDRKLNQLQRELGSKESRIKSLEDLCNTDNDCIKHLEQKVNGLESLLSKYGTVHRDSFTPHNYILNVLKYKDEIIKQGHFCAKGKTYEVIQTTRHDELK